MVMSAPGHIVYSSYNTLYGHSLSGGGLVILKALIISLLTIPMTSYVVRVAVCGVVSKSKLRLTRKPTLRCVCA